MNDAYVALLARALEPERPEEERWRYAYQALRMLCNNVVVIRESRTKLTAMQRAVAVVDEACEQFGFNRWERQPLLEFAMWAEAKTKIAPFQKIGDILRMVENLGEQRARHPKCDAIPVVIDTPPVIAEYIVVQLPLSGRNVGYQLAKNAVEDLSDTPEPDTMRLVRRARRRLVRDGRLLPAREFCKRVLVSPNELRRRERQGTVIRVRLARRDYYPSLYVRRDRLAFRLARVTRAMKPRRDPWTAFFELVYRFESLGNKTLLQVMRRGVGYRAALRYASAVGA